MSKTKNTETALSFGAAPSAAVDKPAVQFNPSDFQRVELSRTWYKTQPHGAPIAGIILGISGNVAELYKTEYKTDAGAKFVMAVELVSPIPLASGSLVRNGEPVGGSAGDVVYMFLPKVADARARAALKAGHPFALMPVEKRQVKSRQHGAVNAWLWECFTISNRGRVAPRSQPSDVQLPTVLGDEELAFDAEAERPQLPEAQSV